MLNRFKDGFIFGCGFTAAFVLIWMLLVYSAPKLWEWSSSAPDRNSVSESGKTKATKAESNLKLPQDTPILKFHDLSLEEKIKHSSAILLTKYEPEADGKMRAVNLVYLKKDAEPEETIVLGKENVSRSYYPDPSRNFGDGNVIFYAGSPGEFIYSTNYYGDRIPGLNNIPIELFKEKIASVQIHK